MIKVLQPHTGVEYVTDVRFGSPGGGPGIGVHVSTGIRALCLLIEPKSRDCSGANFDQLAADDDAD